jgi:hypothetical protein
VDLGEEGLVDVPDGPEERREILEELVGDDPGLADEHLLPFSDTNTIGGQCGRAGCWGAKICISSIWNIGSRRPSRGGAASVTPPTDPYQAKFVVLDGSLKRSHRDGWMGRRLDRTFRPPQILLRDVLSSASFGV